MERFSSFDLSSLSLWAGLALSFSGGLLSSASPCVLAALPAACAVTSNAPVRRRLSTALIFTLATTVALTLLGVLSAYVGRSLSFSMRGLSIVFGVALLLAGGLIISGLNFGGAIDCRVQRPASTGWSAFVFGLLFGTVISPCATPMLIAILGLLAAGSDPIRAAIYMAAYSLGHCVFIFAASLSWEAIRKLFERYGAAAEIARKATGVFLCVAGAMILYSML